MLNEINISKSKKGSSRRKGDEYQDATALRIALDLYIKRETYSIKLEYEKAGSLDDIFVILPTKIMAYQVKYAVDNNSLYDFEDLLDEDSKIYFRKFSQSWKRIKELYPEHALDIILLTNRSLGAKLANICDGDGKFKEQFIENRMRKEPKQQREKLKQVCALEESEFKQFLREFSFQVKKPARPQLEEYILTNLLHKKLGITDKNIYFSLLHQIKLHAIDSEDAITAELIDSFLKDTQRKYLLPQRFNVDKSSFVLREKFQLELDKAVENLDGQYVIVTGLPGSGKSTSLTMYMENLRHCEQYDVIKYYCFVDINDDHQRKRLESKTLRINLLSSLQEKYADVLNERFNYSEEHFIEVLDIIGKHLSVNQKKLIILLDGLDHAERMQQDIRDTVIEALPKKLPQGILVVIGTQELNKWPFFLKQLLQDKQNKINIPFFSKEEVKQYLADGHNLTLSEEQVDLIYKKSEGLPLYLRYIAEHLKYLEDSHGIDIASEELVELVKGDINTYYAYLWEHFEEKGKVRSLCGVLSCLRFPVHIDDLINYQEELDYSDFSDSFNTIKHLLKNKNDLIEIFHNSFREFVKTKHPIGQIQKFNKAIYNYLKQQEYSVNWFSYVFKYALLVEDYDYPISQVNQDFIETALIKLRASDEIMESLLSAAEAAKLKGDIVALTKIGPLKAKTNERLEHGLNSKLISEILIECGDFEDLIRTAYSNTNETWQLSVEISLGIINELAIVNFSLAEELYYTFLQLSGEIEFENNREIILYSKCLANFDKNIKGCLEWLSEIEIQPDRYERFKPIEKTFAPHLEVYIDALILRHGESIIEALKSNNSFFPEEAVQYYIVRSLARRGNIEKLQVELREYSKKFPITDRINLELQYISAIAGLYYEIYEQVSVPYLPPSLEKPEYISYKENIFDSYRYFFIILGYEGNIGAINEIKKSLNKSQSWWNSYLLYLLTIGEAIGKFLKKETRDFYELLSKAIDHLVNIEEGVGERIYELIDACREELPKSLYLVTKILAEHDDSRIDEWFINIKRLFDSNIWQLHYGINESMSDFTFELKIFNTLSKIPMCRPRVLKILSLCEERYDKRFTIKGESRSEHYLRLAAIAGRCENREKARELLQKGIKSSLIYGYHKDITLFRLIDVCSIVNEKFKDAALERLSNILELINWMPSLTDGRETKYLPIDAFKAVYKVNRLAALELLNQFFETKGRWKVEGCLKHFILNYTGSEIEILWALASTFTIDDDPSDEDLRSISEIKSHVLDLIKVHKISCYEKYKSQYYKQLKFQVPPSKYGYFPSYLELPVTENDISLLHKNASNRLESENKADEEYVILNCKYTYKELKNALRESFDKFSEIIIFTKNSPIRFDFNDLIEENFQRYIGEASQINELDLILNLVIQIDPSFDVKLLKLIGERFLHLGSRAKALDVFEIGYDKASRWEREPSINYFFEKISELSKGKAKDILLDKAYRSIVSFDYGGAYAPIIVANGLNILKEYESLKSVYTNYEEYCDSLFWHIPKGNEYSWLVNFQSENVLFDKLALKYIIKQLSTPEVSFGKELVGSCYELILSKPDCIEAFVNALSLDFSLGNIRLLQILDSVSYNSPDYLVEYQSKLSPLLSSKYFIIKMTAIQILKRLQPSGSLSDELENKILNVESIYTREIFTPKSIFLTNATSDFIDFYHNNIHRVFNEVIEQFSEALNVDFENILGYFEKYLISEKWSITEQYDVLKNEWDTFSHPQGFPYVPFYTSFNVRILEAFNVLVEEFFSVYFSTNEDTIRLLFKMLKLNDPEYQLMNRSIKPSDISILNVENPEQWLKESELNNEDIPVNNLSGDWIVVYDKYLSNEDKTGYQSEFYTGEFELASYLLLKSATPSFGKLIREGYPFEGICESVDYEEISLLDGKEFLLDGYPKDYDGTSILYPILSFHNNYAYLFRGYKNIVSLTSTLIRKYKLKFIGFNLYMNDVQVTKFEDWQEGYVYESYSDEALAKGTRLSINKEFLQRVCNDYNVQLCQCISEKRYSRKRFTRGMQQKIQGHRFQIAAIS